MPSMLNIATYKRLLPTFSSPRQPERRISGCFVHNLAVLAEVEADFFVFRRDAQRDDGVRQLVQRERADRDVRGDEHERREMMEECRRGAVDKANVLREDAGQDHADHSSNAMTR